MFARIRSLIDRLHEVQEVNALSDRDLDDLGLSRDQVLAFLRMPRDIDSRVTAMGAIFGLSESQLKQDHGLWVDLLGSCGQCAEREACASVLAGGAKARPDEASFCGNRAAFADLAGAAH